MVKHCFSSLLNLEASGFGIAFFSVKYQRGIYLCYYQKLQE